MLIKHVTINGFKGLKGVVLDNLGAVNAIIGRNNSGKSSVLHAIDVGLQTISHSNWNNFKLKLAVRDLIRDDPQGFRISFTYHGRTGVNVKLNASDNPTSEPIDEKESVADYRLDSILVLPESESRYLTRTQKAPRSVWESLRSRDFTTVSTADILFCLRYYSENPTREIDAKAYSEVIGAVRKFFPQVTELSAKKSEDDVATVAYRESADWLDILYSGAGMKHFLDILVKVKLSGAKVLLIDEPEQGLHPDLQRQFFEYLWNLASEGSVQVFLATHSPVLLNYMEQFDVYKIALDAGNRKIKKIDSEVAHTLFPELGVRPSDLLGADVCLMVEGPTDVVFWEHVIRTLFETEFKGVALTIQQYGGGSAEKMFSGAISVDNITAVQANVLWTKDRDAKPGDGPATQATKMKNALEKAGHLCHILEKREIEWYFPERVHVAAQQGDATKEAATRAVLNGDQSVKYRAAGSRDGFTVPEGVYLRKLLSEHMKDKSLLDPELKTKVIDPLLALKKGILGES